MMKTLIVPILGTSTVAIFAVLVYLWDRRCRRHVRTLDSFDPRIIVTGTRGKSSTVRLIHSVLRAAGGRPWARVTGTVTEEIDPDNHQQLLARSGQTSVIEFLGTVSRAEAAHATSLVTESMAVKPELIELSQDTFVRARICVVTNVRADHMEDEGLDLHEIAHSLASIGSGAELLVTCEHDAEIVSILRDETTMRGARFIHARASDVAPDVLAQLPDEHPDNVAVVLAIAEELGISPQTAVAGMRRTTHEPLAVEPITHRTTIDGTVYTFANLGAINDPESSRVVLDEVESELASDTWRIGIISSRWDRPLRSMEFAGFTDPTEFDRLLLAGPLFHVMRRQLKRNGWDLANVRSLRWIDLRSTASFLRRLTGLSEGHERVTVVNLANVDPPVTVRLLAVLDPYRIERSAEASEAISDDDQRVLSR